jgi:hypothetical protein
MGACTNAAFDVVAEARSPEEVDHSAIGNDLYRLRIVFDGVSFVEEGFDETDTAMIDSLADDVGLLACLPSLNADTRGFAYAALQRLCEVGIVHAIDVLRACLRWEWDDDLVLMIADTLAQHPGHRARDDAVLVLLKTGLLRDPWPLDCLNDDDALVRLRHFTRRLTAVEIAKLAPPKRQIELGEQMSIAIRDGDAVKLEEVLRAAALDSGIAYSSSNFFAMRTQAPNDASVVLPTLVAQCARDWPSDLRARLWAPNFELLVFGPLAALDHSYGEACGAAAAIRAYASAMEAPLLEDEGRLRDLPKGTASLVVVRLAHAELEARRRTIDALYERAEIRREGSLLKVEVFSFLPDFEASAARDRLRQLHRSSGTLAEKVRARFGPWRTARRIAEAVLERWSAVPD